MITKDTEITISLTSKTYPYTGKAEDTVQREGQMYTGLLWRPKPDEVHIYPIMDR